MNFLSQLKSTLTAQFNGSQIEGTSKLAPRPGHYYIRSIEYREIGITKKSTAIATVNWVSDINSSFLEDAVFEIALNSLFEDESKKANQIAALVGCTIFVSEVGLSHMILKGKTISNVKIQWQVTSTKPHFFTESDAAIWILFKNDNETLATAWGRAEASFPELKDSINAEGEPVDQFWAEALEAEAIGLFVTESDEDSEDQH